MEAMLDRIDPVFELCGARVEFVNAATDFDSTGPDPTYGRPDRRFLSGTVSPACSAYAGRRCAKPSAGFEVAWVAGADRVPLVSCSEVSLLLSLFSFCRSAVAPLAPPRRVTR